VSVCFPSPDYQDSAWSRGQAWAIYGFANMYKLTKDEAYLQTSQRAAEYFLGHLPDNGVVPWDFNSPENLADTSAATTAASGLLHLARVDNSPINKLKWIHGALKVRDTFPNWPAAFCTLVKLTEGRFVMLRFSKVPWTLRGHLHGTRCCRMVQLIIPRIISSPG
jgi:hypothetical protein